MTSQAPPLPMPSPAAPAPSPSGISARARRRAVTHLAAVAQLAAVGIVGAVCFSVLFVFLSIGVALTPVFGIGLLFLVALVYLLFALSWIEHERVEGLYRYGIPALRTRSSGRLGFTGWLRTVWMQFTDGAMWRGVASAAISTVLGLLILPAIRWFVTSVTMLFTPLLGGDEVRIPLWGMSLAAGWAPLVGILGILASVSIVIGIALLHAVLTRAVLVPSREALLAEQARTAGVQREGAVRASEVERTRIERDLHDGVQPRLVSVAMTLGLAQQKIDTDPIAAKALVDEAHTSTKAAITELRQLARGIHASVLDDRGLDAALSALAARSPVPVQLDVRLSARRCPEAEAAVYFAVAESLTNAAKHSRGSQARVSVREREDPTGTYPRTIWARVEDNGIGGAGIVPGGGLDGITNRVLAAGGTARLDSPAGGPTALEVEVPCAS